MGEYRGVSYAKDAVSVFAAGRESFFAEVETGYFAQYVRVSEIRDGVKEYKVVKIDDTAPAVVVLRAIAPAGHDLATVEDFGNSASGIYVQTVASTPQTR